MQWCSTCYAKNGVWASQVRGAGTPDTVRATPNKFNMAVQHLLGVEAGLSDAATRFLGQLADDLSKINANQLKKQLSNILKSGHLIFALISYNGLEAAIAEQLAMLGMIAANSKKIASHVREFISEQNERAASSESSGAVQEADRVAQEAAEVPPESVARQLDFSTSGPGDRSAVSQARLQYNEEERGCSEVQGGRGRSDQARRADSRRARREELPRSTTEPQGLVDSAAMMNSEKSGIVLRILNGELQPMEEGERIDPTAAGTAQLMAPPQPAREQRQPKRSREDDVGGDLNARRMRHADSASS
jgi:hypothetical protein